MKKTLSVILAVLLFGMTMAVGVAATHPPVNGCQRDAVRPPVDVYSLQIELPEVTGITAVWNGEVTLDNWLWPTFGPDNVEITVSFAAGAPETLTRWSGGAYDGGWQIDQLFYLDEQRVVFFYWDTNLERAVWEATPNFCCMWCNWDDIAAIVPHDEITFPADFLETFVDGFRPIAAMTLDETVTTTQQNIFSFTPQTSRQYRFEATGDYWYTLIVFNMDDGVYMNVTMWPGRGADVWLQAGQTYYALVSLTTWDGEQPEGERGLTVTEASSWGGGSSNILQRILWWMDDVSWGLQQTLPGRIVWIVTIPLVLPVFLLLTGLEWIIFGW